MSSSFLTGDSTSSLFFPLHNMEREKIFQIPPKFLILNLEISNMDSISHQPIHLSQIVLNGVHSYCTDRDDMSLWSPRWSMWRTCTEMRSADQISDGNQDQMTMWIVCFECTFSQKLKVQCWSKGSWTRATVAPGWAPLHLLPGRGQGICADTYLYGQGYKVKSCEPEKRPSTCKTYNITQIVKHEVNTRSLRF